MDIGIFYPSTELVASPQTARSFAQGAEQLGCDYLSIGDHVLGASHDREPPLWGPYDEHEPFTDAFVLMGYLSAIVDRLAFSTGVLILPQRQTALVAKQAADVAILSDNRLRLGIGVGWSPVEFEAMGQDFRRRGRRATEQITLLQQLWDSPLLTAEIHGERIDRAALQPRPERSIPIWVGGSTEAAFQRASRLADGFMYPGNPEASLKNMGRIEELRIEHGRADHAFGHELIMIPPAPAEDKWSKNREASVDLAVETAERWRAAGGTHVTVYTAWMGFRGVDEHLDFAAKVISQVHANF